MENDIVKRIIYLRNVIKCVKLFISFKNDIEEFYRPQLVSAVDNKTHPSGIDKIKNRIIQKEKELEEAKKACRSLDSSFKLSNAIDKIHSFEEEERRLSNELANNNAKSLDVFVDEWTQNNDDTLPILVPLGQERIAFDEFRIKKQFSINLKQSGGIIVNNPSYEFDDKLSRFLSAFIIGLFKSFPVGSLRIILVDPERKYKDYYRFENFFRSKGEIVSQSFKYLSDYEELFKNIEDLQSATLSKLQGEITDFYSLYNIDKDQKFTYVICLSGLKNQIGSSYHNNFSKLNELISANGNFNRCGIKSLFVDNLENDNTMNFASNLEELKKKSFCVIEYKGGVFSTEKSLEMLTIRQGTVGNYIEQFASSYVNEASKRTASVIRFNDIGFGQLDGDYLEPVLTIPIGKSGKDVVELTFNCCGSAGNLGYMVVGSSNTGKSTLAHSLIMNGCMKYSPDALEYWILDFKQNQMADRYVNSKVPHIARIAPNSKPDDAASLLSELKTTLEARNRFFGKVANAEQNIISNLVDYNKIAQNQPNKYKPLPRIILIIDELQNVLNDRSVDSDLKKMVANDIIYIINNGRSSGIHLVLISQSLEEVALIENFVKQNIGHISYKLASSNVERPFHQAILDIKDRVVTFQPLTAAVSFSENTVKETKIATEDNDTYPFLFKQIVDKYHQYEDRLLKVGERSVLRLHSVSPTKKVQYLSLLEDPRFDDKIIGEDYVALRPTSFKFTEENNCPAILYGSNRITTSSILTSLFIQVLKDEKAKIYVTDGIQRTDTPFTYLVNKMGKNRVKIYPMFDIDKMIHEIYTLFIYRQIEKEKSLDCRFTPVYVFISSIEQFNKISSNVPLTKKADKDSKVEQNVIERIETPSFGNMALDDKMLEEFDVFLKEKQAKNYDQPTSNESPDNYDEITFSIPIVNAVKQLLKEGYRVGIYMVCSTINDSSNIFAGSGTLASSSNVVVYCDNLCEGLKNTRAVKDILESSKSDGYSDAIAVAYIDGLMKKIRPIIYHEDEFDLLLNLINK